MRMEIKDDKCSWNEAVAKKRTWPLWDFNSRSARYSGIRGDCGISQK